MKFIDAIVSYYSDTKANIHRGQYDMALQATNDYEQARKIVADFFNAQIEEIIFTSGTTAAINMVARSLEKTIPAGSNIVLTRMEHHANLIPWQQLAKRTNAELRFIELTNDFEIDIESAQNVIDSNTAVLAMTHVSNTLGTVVPVKDIISYFRGVSKGIALIDGCQAVAHMNVDVKDIDADMYVCSGHKLYGPTGVGVLYGKKDILQNLDPSIFGGDMIKTVSYENATWDNIPHAFEAGTPHIAGVIGLAKAIVFIQNIGWDTIVSHEREIRQYAVDALSDVSIVGPKKEIGIISFTVVDMHHYDVSTLLGKMNIAVRSGHHCTMPLMKHLGLAGTVRASFGIYTSKEDIDALVAGLKKVKMMLK